MENHDQLASAIRGIEITRGLHWRFGESDARNIADKPDELRKRVLYLLENIGDLASWNDGRLKSIVKYSVDSKLISAGELARIEAAHGLTGLVTL